MKKHRFALLQKKIWNTFKTFFHSSNKFCYTALLLTHLFFLPTDSVFATEPKSDVKVVHLACGGGGNETMICKQGAEIWEKQTGHKVKYIDIPNSSTSRLALFQQLLASKHSSIDVLQIDVIWPGVLGQHLIDLKEILSQQELDSIREHFPQMIANNTVHGRLVALPWFTDAGLLYYRKDLLEKYKKPVPQTWEELAATAMFVQQKEREQGRKNFWGYLFQGRAYEGLTCNALEWIASQGGGEVVNSLGQVTVNNEYAQKAFKMAASWINTISPPGVLNYSEEEGRGVFQSEQALFMRNWPYAWSLFESPDSPIKGKMGVAPLPKGTSKNSFSAATLGGWQLGVSKYSLNPKESVSLALHLTSYKEQKRRALVGSYAPTYPKLYEDKEVLAKIPYFVTLKEVLKTAVARPSSVTGFKYNQVSSAFWNAAHASLSKGEESGLQLASLERRLQRISRNGAWSNKYEASK